MAAITGSTLFSACLFAMVAAISYAMANVPEWIARVDVSGRPLWMLVTALATGVLGAAFFFFRLKQRLLYGATEALAGVAVAAHRASMEPGTGLASETGFYFAVLTAGVYLVVRGLDNVHQALKDGDPTARLMRLIRGR